MAFQSVGNLIRNSSTRLSNQKKLKTLRRQRALRQRLMQFEQLERRNLFASVTTNYAHVVVAIFENRNISEIIGSVDAPYFNSLASQGSLLTNSFGITHPSQPNYLHLFSGDDQGIDGNQPLGYQLDTPNLGAALLGAGKTFTGYYEDADDIRHHPWTNWMVDPPGTNQLPSSVHQLFSSFPTDFNTLPTVSFVSPSDANNMHDGSVADGNAWLASNLSDYANWAKNNNSLLVVTFDEDRYNGNNEIATIFFGAGIKSNFQDATLVNHHNLLRTIEDIYGTSHSGQAAFVPPITGVFGGKLQASLSNGNLTIIDSDPTGRANSLSVRTLSNGIDLQITDEAESFSAAPLGGILSNGGRTLTIPKSAITNKIGRAHV